MFDFDVKSGEIFVYDQLGPDWAGMIDGGTFGKALRAMNGKDVKIRVNSPGGSVFEGAVMHQLITEYKGKTTVMIDALAASAASYFILAADEVIAAKNSMIMIHHPWGVTMGNAEDHRKTIEILDKLASGYVDVYANKSGKKPADVIAAMDAETWFTAKEALDFGLIDSVDEPSDVTAHVPNGMFAKTPDSLLVAAKPGAKTPFPNREKLKESMSRLEVL